LDQRINQNIPCFNWAQKNALFKV